MNRLTAIDDADALHDDPEVVRVLEAYLSDLESGRDPDRQELIERHPQIADALAECLGGLDFLRKATGPTEWPNADRRLGGFRLLRVIGRGGMGTVYEAEESGTRRRVAVKVLPPTEGNTLELRRFRHEIQAASSLDHPHIVPVETVGEHDGIHFFSMKLIDGGSLAEWSERPSIPGRSTRPLLARDESTWPPASSGLGAVDPTASWHANDRDPNRIAGLMLQAAEALAHAHAQGIVHRDIKPANLLLDGDDRLWVADFGLAYVPGLTRLTRTAAMVGTLRYMAPEQVEPRRGAIDHRTDQYGLGATFFELLAGRPIFPDEDRGTLIARILKDEPVPLRRIDPSIPRDLETIVLTLLAKDPAKRYPSMVEVAGDLKRFLAGRPIHARRPSAIELVFHWFGRHRLTSLAIGLVAVAFVGVLLWNQSRIVRERDATRIERDFSRQAVDDFWTSYSETMLDREPERDPRQRALLEKALAYYERLSSEPDSTWEDRLTAATARRRVAEINLRLGSTDKALTNYDECRKQLSDLRAERPASAEALRESAIVASDRGNLLRWLDRSDDAGQSYKAAADDFRRLVENGSTDPFDRAGLAGVENNQGLLWQAQGQSDAAEACFRSARAKYARLALERSTFLAESASVSHNLAELLAAKGSLAEAERVHREGLRFREQALKDDPRSPRLRREWARTRMRMAALQTELGRRAEAIDHANGAMRDWHRLAVEHPAVPEFSLALAEAIRVWSIALAKTESNGQDLRE